MADEIKPALTAEEWASTHFEDLKWSFPRDRARHATAALALHGQPFGFTWEMVDTIDGIQEDINGEWGLGDGTQGNATLAAIRRVIVALLPPRETK